VFNTGNEAKFEDSTYNLVYDQTYKDDGFKFTFEDSCFQDGTDLPDAPICDGGTYVCPVLSSMDGEGGSAMRM